MVGPLPYGLSKRYRVVTSWLPFVLPWWKRPVIVTVTTTYCHRTSAVLSPYCCRTVTALRLPYCYGTVTARTGYRSVMVRLLRFRLPICYGTATARTGYRSAMVRLPYCCRTVTPRTITHLYWYVYPPYGYRFDMVRLPHVRVPFCYGTVTARTVTVLLWYGYRTVTVASIVRYRGVTEAIPCGYRRCYRSGIVPLSPPGRYGTIAALLRYGYHMVTARLPYRHTSFPVALS